MKFNDPKLKNEILVRIDMKHFTLLKLFVCNQFFCVVETVVVCQKINSC